MMDAGSLPEYSLPPRVRDRHFDIVAIGSLVLEMILELERWPKYGGQDVTRVSGLTYTAGGCALNVACFAGRLGAVASVVSLIGDGDFAEHIWSEIDRSNVDTLFLQRCSSQDGNLIFILTNPDGDWSVLDYLNPALMLRDGDIPSTDQFEKIKIAHIDGFSFINVGRKDTIDLALDRARQAGCVISVDGSVPAAQTEPQFLAHLFTKANIAFANIFEALAVTETSTVDEAVLAFQKLGPEVSVIKMGVDGSVLITPEYVTKIPAFRVDVIDTVAAGDAYIGTMLYCLCKDMPLVEAANRGSAAGALACLGRGSLSSWFTMKEIEDLIRRGPDQ